MACMLPLTVAGAWSQRLATVLVADGFERPVLVTAPPGDRDRLFVAEQAGRIRIVERGVVREEPFLDLSAAVMTEAEEQGLLSLAFHPAYHRATASSSFTTARTMGARRSGDSARAATTLAERTLILAR